MKNGSFLYRQPRRMAVCALSVFVLSLMLISFVSHAEDDAARAKKMIAKSLKKMGGVKRATQWTTRIDEGLMITAWPGWGTLKANAALYVKKPGKLKFDQDFSAYDHPFFLTYYYNEGDAWLMVNLGTRQNPRYNQRLSEHLRTIDGLAYYYNECDTFFCVTDVPDDSLFSAAKFNRVGVVNEGDTILFDLHKRTKLPIRRINQSENQHAILEDYKKTGRLMMPYHVTVYQNGAMTVEYQWEKISFNKEIDNTIFEEYRPKQEEE